MSASAAQSRSGSSSSKSFRNLANLSDSASTSRIINLSQVSEKEEGYKDKPFFNNAKLNKAIIIKHTLRNDEKDLFGNRRRTATKLILPFDSSDLRLGGGSIFINQPGFDGFCKNFFGVMDTSSNHDVMVLKELDGLPSLDPFIVREHLGRQGFHPAGCYLKISQTDVNSMIGFAAEEIGRIVFMAFNEAMSAASMKFTGKILSNELDKELLPLKATLRLSDEDFSDGIFAWRGFLYFKWRHITLQEELRKLIETLGAFKPFGLIKGDLKEYLNEARPRLAKKLMTAMAESGRILKIYDTAYSALVSGGNPVPFRDFLKEGPKLFYDLGENIGILTHVSSFWNYRMNGRNMSSRISGDDYAEILSDFENSLAALPESEMADAR